MQCECYDCDGCPNKTHGAGPEPESRRCKEPATTTLYRSDMDDREGVAFCEECASDAMDSGVFTSIKPCACGSYDEGECELCNSNE